ncbi:MAG: pyridoxal phosphate-dependent aminotransferase [Candidatus Bathyarchaeia archaeon]
MKHPSMYLDWYVHVPKVRYDFRSSGTAYFTHDLRLNRLDLSVNYDHGNPETTAQLAKWYDVKPENVFVSSEGASGQNARIIRCLAEKSPRKNEAVVEYPTYEPLLRQVQEHFKHVKRLERREEDAYRLDADELLKVVSEKTGLLVLTNPHAPSGATSNANELREMMTVAREHGFYVLCDEIYAEFDRKTVPSLFSVDPEGGIVTTSFTKAYGLGGLKLGIALVEKELVDELYADVLNTVGNSPNVVQLIAAELLSEGREKLEEHKHKWAHLMSQTREWLNEEGLQFFPSKVGVTYWVKLPIKDTYRWTNECTIPVYSLAAVPGTFFLFKNDYKLAKTDTIRLSLGNLNPEKPTLTGALDTLETALNGHQRWQETKQ